jgi:hypothetical protein
MPNELRPRAQQRELLRQCAILALAFGSLTALHAGPPFLTDDPEPVDLHHWEFYTFGQGDRTADANAYSAPAFEFNYGVAPETQLHVIAPLAHVATPGPGWTSGYGDTEVGIKYRFLTETDARPQLGIFPLAELPTGSSARGLGNGKAWYQLPLWAQKSYGPWTLDAGGGVALNSAAGATNHGYAGGLIQRDLGKFLSLGAEVFQQGPATDGDRASTLANVGGYLKFTDQFNVLFSGGRSIAGKRHTVWYLGLYWTGGPSDSGQK